MSTQLPQSYEGAPNDQFDVIPAGIYRADITNYTLKRTRAGDGLYAEIELSLSGGEADGRKVWARHMVQHPNPTAQRIGDRQISDLANAALGSGSKLQDLAQLAAKAVMVEIVVKPGEGQYGPSNEVKRYHPVDQGQAAQQLPASSGSSNDAPW
jgi:hypothetical protein